MTLSYAPYPQAGTLGKAVGLGASSDVIYPAGWGGPAVNLTAEFQAAQGRAPTAAETANLAFFRNMGNLAESEAKKGNGPQNRERDYWNYLGFADFYVNHLLRVDQGNQLGASKPAPGMAAQWQAIADRGNDIVNKKVEASKGWFSKAISAITHAPVSALVNPIDAVVHKVVGDKAYYAVAKAIGGDKVEAALKAGNNSLADLSKGKTRAELLSQGIEVAKVAVQEKLTPEQVNTVLASLPPETAQAARDALAGKPPSASAPTVPASSQLRTLDPPKRPAAAPAAAPLRTLDPPKRPAQTLAPPQKAAAPAPPSAGAVQPSAVAPGVFVYAPYPKTGALSGPPPDCLSLGPPITDMDGGMRHAGLSAVNGSRGRSRMVAGPDGKDYLFALEGGALVARQCFSETGLSGPGFRYAPYALNAPPPPHGGHGGGHGHSGDGGRHFSHGGSGAGRGGRGWWGGGPWNYITAVQTCRTWGDPIMMFSEMATAAQQALNASAGRPTTVLGPDGVLYLFAIENGAYTARTCAAVA